MRGTSLCVVLLAYGCGSDADDEPYDTYQECFDQHVKHEDKTNEEAIVICCTNHPIAGIKPVCGQTAPDCINYITDNLDQLSASTVEVMEACQMYEAQLGSQ
jgi:hypothetical protein